MNVNRAGKVLDSHNHISLIRKQLPILTNIMKMINRAEKANTICCGLCKKQ